MTRTTTTTASVPAPFRLRIGLIIIGGWCILYLTGCASIVHGRVQPVSIASTPPGADITIDGTAIGRTPWSGKIDRRSGLQVQISRDGYEPELIGVTGRLSTAFWGNILLGGVFGSSTDIQNGAAYEYQPDAFHVILRPRQSHAATTDATSEITRFALARYAQIGLELSTSRGDGLQTLLQLMGRTAQTPAAFDADIRARFAAAPDAATFANLLATQQP